MLSLSTHFTPIASLVGGALIGAAAVALMALTGRIAGISGITARLVPPYTDRGLAERAAFVFGLIAAPVLFSPVIEGAAAPLTQPPLLILAAGLLVGFGTVWGSGCTSGHGVCGLSRLSFRSLAATLTFMATAALTVFATRLAG
jgi:uncharacterized membrane protein YedE/YeeE